MRLRAAFAFIGIVCVAALLQACSRPLAPQASCGFVQNPELQRVSWKKNLPVRLFVHSSVPVEAYAAIDRAITDYNTRVGKGEELFKIVTRGASGDLNPDRDGYSMIYWYKTWDPNKPTEQARTTIYWTGNQIFEADLRINAKNFDYHYSEDTKFADVDLESLLVHEFGHMLGLAHNSAPGSVMNPTLNDGQERRSLGDPDKAGLACEY